MLKKPIKTHSEKNAAVQAQVKHFFDNKERIRINHGNTNSTRNSEKDPKKLVDITFLNEIIEVNLEGGYAIVEANVAMDTLVDHLLPLGFAPPVVPEFPSITIGGAVQGGAGESSSFKYGCVHETCLEYEVILADGSLVTVSENNDQDLFNSIAGSFGSIGIITQVKLKIVPAKPYVELTYHAIHSYAEAVELISSLTSSTADFIDGIMYSETYGIVMSGMYTQQKQDKYATFHKLTDDWFYLHALRTLNKATSYKETIPTQDYFFRYDRGGFWVAKYGFKIFHVPFNRFTRFILSGLFKTKTLYAFLEGSKLSQSYLFQDICLPQNSVLPLLEYSQDNLGIWPVWLCPLKPDAKNYLSPTHVQTDLVINVGVWGKLGEHYQQFVQQNRAFETEIAKLGGRKVLYAHAYYSEPEFWKIYDQSSYEHVRQKYNAEITFPSIYEKTNVTEQYQTSLSKGMIKMIKAALK